MCTTGKNQWAHTVFLLAALLALLAGCGGGGSSAPAPISEPNVVGQTQTAAATAITGAGLTLGTVTMQSSSTVAAGNVITESPVAGSNVASGTAVNIVVSTGPAPVQVAVPNVVGQTQAAATTAITGAGLTVGTVTMQSSSMVAAGNVITEGPVAGSNVASGTAVNLVVSTGPAPAQVAVPNVVGFTQTAAITSIGLAGLGVGTVVQTFSTIVPAGNVISETPTAGTSVSLGTDVNLAISSALAPRTFTALDTTMTTSRLYHTSTLLPNGQVLLAGGLPTDSSVPLNTAELYDPVTRSFTALPAAMTVNRAEHTATLLANGQVLLTGGAGGIGFGASNAILNTAELYDPVARTFTVLIARMTAYRRAHTATLLSNGQVLLTGGFGGIFDISAGVLNTAELYDPVSQTFTALTAKMTSSRYSHKATILQNGQVLLTGGFGVNIASLNTVEVYDPVAKSFNAMAATMVTARGRHTATLLSNGQVLIAGGWAQTGILDSAEVYDPAALTFTVLPATMTTQRYAHGASLLNNGEVLITGGGSASVPFNTAEIFIP
jgi:beta-lactam-binding protein with PASTA domain